MPKRNKLPLLPDYVGSGKNENLLIQKSNPLLTLSETSMTLPELKILDAYLARINSHKPEKRYVRFEKGELEGLLGVTRMHRDELSRRIKNLFQVVEIQDERKINGFKCISLFEKAECEQDENGLWQVNLMCTNSAMEYIFNIENLGYLKYRLKNVVNLTSRYSYILYLFLEDKAYLKKTEITLEDLKKMLNCKAERYKEFKFFNSEVLKKCQKEINQKTTINFEYLSIKKGRKVIAIEFKIQRNPDKQEINTKAVSHDENNINPVYQEEQAIEVNILPEHPECQSDLSGSFEKDLKPNEIELLCSILANKVPNKPPESLERLLKSLYNEMTLKSKEPVKKPVSYLLRMIDNLEPEKIKKETKTKKSNNGFCVEKYELLSKYDFLKMIDDAYDGSSECENIRAKTLNEIAKLKAIIKEKTGEDL